VAAIRLLGDLRQAIANSELALVYQPKFELATSRIVGAEALLRWPRPDGEVLTPDDFLPLVRRHGLIGSVTDFVLNRALDDALVWHTASFDVPGGGESVRAVAGQTSGSPQRSAAPTADRGLDPAALTVEITETCPGATWSGLRAFWNSCGATGLALRSTTSAAATRPCRTA